MVFQKQYLRVLCALAGAVCLTGAGLAQAQVPPPPSPFPAPCTFRDLSEQQLIQQSPLAPAYYFPELAANAAHPALPVAMTVWRTTCPATGNPILMVRMTAQPNELLHDALKPQVTVIQSGVELGYFGAKCQPVGGSTACFLNDGFIWDPDAFGGNLGVDGSGSELVQTGAGVAGPQRPVFDSTRAFTLRVRDSLAWPAGTSSVEYEIPARGGAGSMLISGRQPGIWWNPAESGWGLSIDRNERGAMYAAWFTYDKQGRATWYVMPDGQPTGLDSVEGAVYSPRGPAYSQEAFDPALVAVGAPVGTFKLQWRDDANGTFSFNVDGVSATKPITRFLVKDANGHDCMQSRGVYWRPEESGWGLALEGALYPWCSLFAAWYTYDTDNRPTWFIMPNGRQTDAPEQGVDAGEVFHPTGPALAPTFDSAQVNVGAPVGTFGLRRLDTGQLEFKYAVGAAAAVKPVDRVRYEY